LRNYTRFTSNVAKYIEAKKHGLTEDLQVSGYHFTKHILNSIQKCKIFEITDDTKKLLTLTKTPKINDMFKLPFPYTFIDAGFTNKEMKQLGIDIGYGEIVGIMITEGKLLYDKKLSPKNVDGDPLLDTSTVFNGEDTVKVGTAMRITILSITNGKVWFDVFNEDFNIYDKYKDYNFKINRVKTANKNARKFVHLFILNFLNFINNPEIEIVSKKPDEKRNERRQKKGKAPIPERRVIKLKGKLKRYADELKKNRKTWTYNYRFWVRGHFRTLKDKERYGDNVGKRIWIPPFTKGKGVLVDKRYVVDKSKSNKVDSI